MAKGLAALIEQRRTNDWLTPLLGRASVTEPEGWGRSRTYVSPSSAGEACERDVQLSQLGHSTGFNEKSRDRMDNGTFAHTRITEKMERAGVLVASNVSMVVFADDFVSFERGLRGDALEAAKAAHGYVAWRGELDVLVGTSSEANVVHVGELKSANTRKYQALPRINPDKVAMARIMLQAEAKYTRQMTQYVVLLQRYIDRWRPGLRVSDECFLLYEHTDSQEYRVIWMQPDEMVREDAFKRAGLAVEATAAGHLIERPFEADSRTCRSCFRKRVCNALSAGDEAEWTSVRTAIAKVQAELTSAGPPRT